MPSCDTDAVTGGRSVGIDVGGTKTLAVAFDPARPDELLAEHLVPTPRSADGVLDAIVDCARAVGVTERIGIGLAGIVDRAGVLRAAPNLGWMVDVDVRGPVAATLGLDAVAVDNDANCALRGEMRLGAARGADDVVLVTLGTGIGGAVAVDGHVRLGSTGLAGEPGHMLVDPAGPVCVCGRRGCWERYASGAGLSALASDAGMGGCTGEEVVARARADEAVAVEVVDRFAWWLAAGLANIVDLLDPELLVIGGGLSVTSDLWLDTVRRSVVEQTLGGPVRRCRIEVARLGPAAGAIGAGLLVDDGAAHRK